MQRAFALADRESRTFVREALKRAGEPVKRDAARRIQVASPRSAAALRVVVRQRGVAVQQPLQKTTGQHPEFGSWQMRRLIGASHAQEEQTVRSLERAMDELADHFNH